MSAIDSSMMSSTPRFQLLRVMLSAARRFVWMGVATILVISNILTVVSESAHAIAFGMVSSISSVIGEVAATRLLSRSPTKVIERKVLLETAGIRGALAEAKAKQVATEASLRKLGDAHAALQGQAAKRTEAVKKFSASAFRRVARNKAVELASLPERALPYAGVVALVGVTAYEIKSDCDLLKDVNELSETHEIGAVDTSSVCGFELPSAKVVWSNAISGASATVKGLYDQLVKSAPALTKPVVSQP